MRSIIWSKKQILTLLSIIWWIVREFATDTAMGNMRAVLATWGPAVVAWDFLTAHPALIVLVVFVGVTIWGFLGQRRKTITSPIPNRDVLFRAISEVQQTSGELLSAQEQLDNLETRRPGLAHVDEMTTRDNAYDNYKQAMKKLNAEKMVAGRPFESLLSDLSGYISTQVLMKTVKPPVVGGTPQQSRILTALEYIGRIAGKISEVTQKIDEISGQAPDKGGSPAE